MSGVFVFAGVEAADPISLEDVKPLLACRGCLAVSRPLRPLERATAALYGELVGTTVSVSDMYPKFLCLYCRALLLKFKAFREICHASQNTFFELYNGKSAFQVQITIDHIKDAVKEDPYSNLKYTDVLSISMKCDNNHYRLIENAADDDLIINDGNKSNTDIYNDTDDFAMEDNISNCAEEPVDNSKVTLKHRLTTKKVTAEAKKRRTKKMKLMKGRKDPNVLEFDNNVDKDKTLKTDTNNKELKSEQTSLKDSLNKVACRQYFTDSVQDNIVMTDNNNSDYNNSSDSENDNIPLTLTKTPKDRKENESLQNNGKISRKTTNIKSTRMKQNKNLQKKQSLKEIKEKETKKTKTKDDKERDRKLKHENKSNVKIVVLSKEEQIKQIETRKNSSNYKRALHKCEFCYRGFNTEYSYKNHMTKHEPSQGDYVCDICSMRYQSKLQLMKHTQAHHIYNFVCNECGFISKSSGDAGKHHRWHKGVKYDCKICGKSFDKPNSVMGHMHLSHGGTVQCSICQAMFLGEKGLRSHIMLTHKDAVGAVCSDCNTQFHNVSALQRHLSVGCDVTRSTCVVCGEGFTTGQLLEEHQKELHKKGYVCETCGALFPDDGKYQSKAAFEDHCRTHSGEKPFKCHLCSKTFATKQACRVHIGRHTAKKGILVAYCRPCNKQFTQRSNYKRHIRVVHQNLRPFSCDICGTSYKDKYPLQTHINTKHLGLPWPKRVRKTRPVPDSDPQL